MMIGCGYCIKTIRRGRYLYFWHYEDQGGRRRQFEEYVGPAGNRDARDEVSRRVTSYIERAKTEMGRFIRDTQAEIAAVR